jgi:hypothetical protein
VETVDGGAGAFGGTEGTAGAGAIGGEEAAGGEVEDPAGLIEAAVGEVLDGREGGEADGG